MAKKLTPKTPTKKTVEKKSAVEKEKKQTVKPSSKTTDTVKNSSVKNSAPKTTVKKTVVKETVVKKTPEKVSVAKKTTVKKPAVVKPNVSKTATKNTTVKPTVKSTVKPKTVTKTTAKNTVKTVAKTANVKTVAKPKTEKKSTVQATLDFKTVKPKTVIVNPKTVKTSNEKNTVVKNTTVKKSPVKPATVKNVTVKKSVPKTTVKPTVAKEPFVKKTVAKETVSKKIPAKITVAKPTVTKETVVKNTVKTVEKKPRPPVKIGTVETVEEKSYPKDIDKRFHQLRFNMEDNKVNCVFISHLPNIRYYTNFSGSAASMLVFNDEIHFFTDDRYEEQVKEELYPLHNLRVHITRDVWGFCEKKKFFKKMNLLGVESEYLSYEDAINIKQRLHSHDVKIRAIKSLAEKYTQPKSLEELEFIKKSCKIAEKVFEHILGFITPGMSELDIAIEIDYRSRLLGSEGSAFDTIVTSGARGALVHGQPSTKKIKKNEIILLDFGCKVNGFCSDISRTICVGKATKEQKNIYELLYSALSAAISEVRPGMKGNYLDNVARSIIKKAGFGNNFQHSLGHGLGLICHEKPLITFRMEDQVIPDGVVLALEPGIYLPGQFGMRVEDDVLVSKNGNIKLTNAPEKLICI